ncbi:MAG: NAD-dependent epimerase/dehydratase family protein [Planctomycetota bacterium]
MAAIERGSTVLVTGACGFIGSHVCEALVPRGIRVIGVDNFDPFYDESLKRANLAAVRSFGERGGAPFAAMLSKDLPGFPGGGLSGSFTFIEADIADAPAMSRVFGEHTPSAVVHLAAKAGVRPSIEDPSGYATANVLGTQVVLEAARAAGCERFVMASSSSVYGNNTKVPFSEDDDVSFPISPYAATKRACELIAHTHHHLTDMPTACLRFFTVFGPRQRPDLAISKFLRLVSSGEPLRMFGDGSTSRDYTYIADIVAGVCAALDRIPDYGYRIWNLGHSEPVSLREMIATIERVVGREADIRQEPMQPGDVERTNADLSRAGAELEFRPTTSFEDGVTLQWRWMQKQARAANG